MAKQQQKTYNSRYSLVVTDPTTNLPRNLRTLRAEVALFVSKTREHTRSGELDVRQLRTSSTSSKSGSQQLFVPIELQDIDARSSQSQEPESSTQTSHDNLDVEEPSAEGPAPQAERSEPRAPQTSQTYPMVQTRRQSQGKALETQPKLGEPSPEATPGKERKRPNDREDSPQPESSRKRQRTVLEAKIQHNRNPGETRSKENRRSSGSNIREDLPVRTREDGQFYVKVPPNISTQSPNPGLDSISGPIDRIQRTFRAIRSPEASSSVEETKSSQGNASRKLDLPVKDVHDGLLKKSSYAQGVTKEPVVTLEGPEDASEKPVKKPKAAHKRFESEDASAPVPAPSNGLAPNEKPEPQPSQSTEDSEGTSDDDAPEAESLSTGQARAKALAFDANKAAQTQDRAAREKRKAKSARLQSQAELSKQKRRRSDKVEEDDLSDHDGTLDPSTAALDQDQDMDISKKSASSSLVPALLPDDILAAEPAERPPTPPLQSSLPKPLNKQSQRHKFLDVDEKKPKDFKRSGVKIRTLEARTHRYLAPKAVNGTRSLREQWLIGQRDGRKQGEPASGQMERRKPNKGFLRR
ncbi:MAG: hypothetical protein M4579_000027 [Chaenotheca gracillima]|nr:MAG: hypothetical protein M4579_000027 [Chaenotheca gracillima]